MIDHLSFPSLKSKDRIRNLKKRKERDEYLAKVNAKNAVIAARKQRKRDRKERRLRLRREEEEAALAHEERIHKATTVLQRFARWVLGWNKVIKSMRLWNSTIKLQARVRGYITCRQMKKVLSLRDRRTAKKLAMLKASVCLIVAYKRWIKRSRRRRWVYMLREVRAALQGDERIETAATESGTKSAATEHGIHVDRSNVGAAKTAKKLEHQGGLMSHATQLNRRGSAMSMLAGVCFGNQSKVREFYRILICGVRCNLLVIACRFRAREMYSVSRSLRQTISTLWRFKPCSWAQGA
jgi:hypothetical protein